MSDLPRARKRFGQHFLHDPKTIQRIVDSATALNPQHIVEIGPGQGAITTALQSRSPSLTLIEIDRDLADYHRTLWQDKTNVTIIEQDVLSVNFNDLEPKPYVVVGNLPYNISTPILFRLQRDRNAFSSAILMLQKEVVERITALHTEKERGRLSIGMQRWFRVERLCNVPASAFKPPPKVESAVIKIVPLREPKGGECDEALLENIVKQSFSQRRKMLRKSLSSLVEAQAFTITNIDPTRRPETLSLEEFVALCRAQSHLLASE